MKNSVLLNGNKVYPSKVICIGRNYVEHIYELGNETPRNMVVFLKPNSAISSQLQSFHQEPLHYEGEICFLYQKGRFSAVGFGLDLTKRKLQSELKSQGLPWERAKGFDGAALFSEFVTIDSTKSLSMALSINQKLVQQGCVDLMIYSPEKILNDLQSFMKLEDGDIVMTGTPKGVGVVQADDLFEGVIKVQGVPLTSENWQAH